MCLRRYSKEEIASYLSCAGRRSREKRQGKPVQGGAHIVVPSGLLIGLVYGAVGLLSDFCLVSGLRGWWASGDSRLIRSYALALGVAIVAVQLLDARGVVDLGKSIYLQASFSAPLMFVGGLLFGYGMVLATAAARARWCCSAAAICARLSW